jgi:hypothetical protein
MTEKRKYEFYVEVRLLLFVCLLPLFLVAVILPRLQDLERALEVLPRLLRVSLQAGRRRGPMRQNPFRHSRSRRCRRHAESER